MYRISAQQEEANREAYAQQRAAEKAERESAILAGRIAASADERRAIAKSRGLVDTATACDMIGCNANTLQVYASSGHILRRSFGRFDYFSLADVAREAVDKAKSRALSDLSLRLDDLVGHHISLEDPRYFHTSSPLPRGR